ncbi:helicase associated domain-containing protein [Arthrobacter sp. AFG20]|uniref:helicase associated domain-containing protein n=1 Tax=Arthrobacter sp. AFG20 TaxID=1688671 RepID=UPI0011AFBAA8|nr:helicase associated domain-containing protein [Arthrobacter sp. AFG20]
MTGPARRTGAVPDGRAGPAPHTAAVIGEEHDLGVRLHAQRQKARRGDLEPDKARALDEVLPGWRTGRQRGRKPHAVPIGVQPVLCRTPPPE